MFKASIRSVKTVFSISVWFLLKVPLRFHLNFLSRNAALLAEAKVSLFAVYGCYTFDKSTRHGLAINILPHIPLQFILYTIFGY